MLADQEIAILRAAGFDNAVGAFIRSQTNKKIERARGRATALDDEVDADGLSIAVSDGEEAEQLIRRLQPGLIDQGCRSFWSRRHEPNGLRTTDEIVILKTNDETEIIRFRHTSGANYDITTEDILDRLKSWRDVSEFEVAGADHDFVMLVFSRLPDRICDFAAEVIDLCSDKVDDVTGPGSDRRKPDIVRAAKLLCPSVQVKLNANLEQMKAVAGEYFEDLLGQYRLAIRMLALKLKQTNQLFLWWD